MSVIPIKPTLYEMKPNQLSDCGSCWGWIQHSRSPLSSLKPHCIDQLALEKLVTSFTTRDGWICKYMASRSIRELELSWVRSLFCLNPPIPSPLKWQRFWFWVVLVTGTSLLKTHSSSGYIFVDLRYAIMNSLIDSAFIESHIVWH